MLKNLVPSEIVELYEYKIEFLYPDMNSGFGFPCDENGVLLEMSECALENYKDAMNHPERFAVYNHFQKTKRRYREPAHGKCKCGEEVYLQNQYYGACECPNCGQWYNLFGQELLSPNEWGLDYDY